MVGVCFLFLMSDDASFRQDLLRYHKEMHHRVVVFLNVRHFLMQNNISRNLMLQ